LDVGTLQNTFEGRPGDVRNFCLLTKETLASLKTRMSQNALRLLVDSIYY